MLYVFYFLAIGDWFFQFKISLVWPFCGVSNFIRIFRSWNFSLLIYCISAQWTALIITISGFVETKCDSTHVSQFQSSHLCNTRNSVLILFCSIKKMSYMNIKRDFAPKKISTNSWNLDLPFSVFWIHVWDPIAMKIMENANMLICWNWDRR